MTNTNVIHSYLQQTIAVTSTVAATTLTNSNTIWPTTPPAVKLFQGRALAVNAKLLSLKVYLNTVVTATSLNISLGGIGSGASTFPLVNTNISFSPGSSSSGIAMIWQYPIPTLFFVDADSKLSLHISTNAGTCNVEGIQFCFELLG